MTQRPALRIAMTSYYLPSESKIGAGYMAHRLAQTLVHRGHAVTMFSPCRRPDDAAYHHCQVPMSGSLRTFRWAARVRRLDLHEFDVVHAHGDNHLRWGRRPPVVRTLHGSCFSEARYVHGLKERLRMFLLGLTEIAGSVTAARTVGVSRNSLRFTPWVRTAVPNGVDTDLFRPGRKEERPTILFVGTYGQRKRGKLLVETFRSEVLPHVPTAQLWMVCTDAPTEAGVEVLGRLSDDELADRYRRAWVFCLPSTYEGFGVPYIEAMASGTAVVASPNPGAREVLADGGGVAVPDRLLGPTLRRLLEDQARREALAAEGLATSIRYRWDRVAEMYEDTYQRLIETRSAGHSACENSERTCR